MYTGGEDYASFGTSFTFEADSNPGTRFCVNIAIFDDAVVERDEVIVVVASILSTRGVFYQSDGNNTLSSIITILDNEGECVRGVARKFRKGVPESVSHTPFCVIITDDLHQLLLRMTQIFIAS